MTTILKNHFGFKENSHLVAHTYCEVDYFRKDPGKKKRHIKSNLNFTAMINTTL